MRTSSMLRLVFCVLAGGAAAQPPLQVAQSSSDLSAWFKSLRQPANGISCCDESDCRVTKARPTADGWEAQLGARWVAIPEDKIIAGAEHPLTGQAVLCATPQGYIYCFVIPRSGG